MSVRILLRQLVYCETGAGLDALLVDGDVIMQDGRPVRIDEAAIWPRRATRPGA